MNAFMDKDFLLDTEAARRLFEDYAKDQPILDFHCHLPPSQIAEDKRFANIAEIWLGGDHYKWRAMRSNGIPEASITGHAPDKATFDAWAATVPKLYGNPLYHWTHLELQRYFGIKDPLAPSSADSIWSACNEKIAKKEFSVRGLLKAMKVKAVCTTDDPVDTLEHHVSYAKETAADPGLPKMFPTFRPDKALAFENANAWNAYVDSLASASGMDVRTYADFLKALDSRHAFFHSLGCRATDHALVVPPAKFADPDWAGKTFLKIRSGAALDAAEAETMKGTVLKEIGAFNHKRGWVMQLHMGAIRNLNSSMFGKLGPDTGYDAISDAPVASALALLLDSMAKDGALPKTMLYTLEPAANEALCTIMGCFQDGVTPGKIQFGSAWWFNDHLDGMRKQLVALANMGVLSRFVGMLTDSRSFLSFPRHEYFRRLLCSIVGEWMEKGEIPPDFETAGSMVKAICYGNAAAYFDLPGID